MSTAAQRMGSGWTKQWQLTLLLGAIEIGLSQVRPPLVAGQLCNGRQLQLASDAAPCRSE